MKRELYYILLGMASLCWGCSESEDIAASGGDESITFKLSTKAGGITQTVSDQQQARLFVAERLSEHVNKPGEELEGLHCGLDKRYDLPGGHLTLSGLFGQWYKFAFVCVPKPGGDESMGKALFEAFDPKNNATEHDFNKLMINYEPVLRYQQEKQAADNEDLAIYREVINRWVDPVNPTTEDVVMTRITGELIIDLGIPVDQFEHPVEKIVLHVPKMLDRIYIRDRSNGEIIQDETARIDDYIFICSVNNENMHKRQTIRFSLLPQVLNGAYLEVSYTDSTKPDIFMLQSKASTAVEVRKNVKTTVLFNGYKKDWFEVRYAGFDDQADIDVDNDDWDGWN